MSTTFGLFNTSVMGMAAQSDALSSISENISNANTVGYKDAETQFSTVLTGLQNGEMSGGGVTTVNSYAVARQGSLTQTSSPTDLAIKGKGFFAVRDANGAMYLTRAGSFVQDSQGRLVNLAGYYLMGFSTANTPTGSSTNALSSLQTVTVLSNQFYATPSTSGTLAANLPSTASTIAAANLPSVNSGTLSQYTAKTSFTAYDDLGKPISLDAYFAKTGTGAWQMTVFDGSTATNGGFPYTGGPLVTQTLAFSSTTGALTSGNPVAIPITGGATLSLDISSTTQLATNFGVNSVNVNGNQAASVTGVQIDSNGTLSYTLSNGQPVAAYNIPLANVNSPVNMTSVTGNVYSPSNASGQIMLGAPGTGALGQIQSDALESSTVDLAQQLSDMIVAQRSFTANTQSFQVASDILQVLNNLK
jgi:flagellar hook protein FlgE